MVPPHERAADIANQQHAADFYACSDKGGAAHAF